jgi:hypothetical protein
MAARPSCVPGRGCLALRVGCWAARRRPRTSSRTSGFGGRPLIGPRSAIRWPSWSRRPRDSRSTCSVRPRAQRDLCRAKAAGAGRHQRRSGLGGRAGRGVEPSGATSAGEALANRARGVRASRGLQLSLPEDCRPPSSRRSQRAAGRQQSAGACFGKTARARESGQAAAPAQCVRCRCEDG